MLTRAAGRQREIAIRAALGAGNGRLARQMLTESLTLAAAGGALGIVLAYGLVEALKRFGPPGVRRLDRAALDGSVLLVTAGATVITGLLLGSAPAMLAARRALNNSLRDSGRGSSAGTRTNRLREAFTIAQIALSLVLLAGAGLLVRSFARLIAVEPGFRTDHVLTMNISFYRDQKGV